MVVAGWKNGRKHMKYVCGKFMSDSEANMQYGGRQKQMSGRLKPVDYEIF